MTISSPGIGSNLDVNGIVSKLMQVESQPLTKLAQKEASYQAQLTAYGTLSGAVSSFQNAMSGLASASRFLAMKATPSDSTVVSATAANSAVAGNYSIEVSSLAQQQKLVAAGQTSVSAPIGVAAATLTFDFGTITGTLNGTGQYNPGATFVSAGGGTKTVTITPPSNTLSGIRDAINAAGIGVTATIVNDGTASPYRLVLTSNTTGAANSMKISVSGDATVASLLANDPAGTQNLSETQTAKNAALKVDGMAVTKSSNTITDVVPGVTLNLLKTNVGAPITLAVTSDTSTVQASAQNFVDTYNALYTSVNSLTYYNASNKTAGALQGDLTANNITNDIRLTLSSALVGAGGYSNLSQLGISMQKDGTLKLDTTKLQTAISNNSVDIAAVFAQTGRATDGLLSYRTASSSTKAGSYAVNVTQMATQGKSVGSGAVGNLTIDATNDTLQLSLDGTASSVAIARGVYATSAALAQAVQSAINGNTSFTAAGSAVAVSASGGNVITITSNRYGSASTVSVTGGNGMANLLGAPVATGGLDVAGSIGGVSAIGSGQTLTGATSTSAAGLQVLVTGGSTGARGSVYYSNGYASQLSQLASQYVGTTGLIANRTDGINTTIKDLGKQSDELTSRLTAVEARYRAQFTALDTLMSSMIATQNYLTQQLAALSNTKISG